MAFRIILAVLGCIIGCGFNMIPGVAEKLANTNVCVESCTALLRGTAIATYAAMPIAWGIILAKVVGKPHAMRTIIYAAFVSLAIMLLLTWFLYKHQHP